MLDDMTASAALTQEPTRTVVPLTALPTVTSTQPTIEQLTDQAGFMRTAVGALQEQIEDVHQRLRSALLAGRAERLKESPKQLLDDLSDLGFAWRHIASMISVSVPAVQKWRRGEKMSPENLDKLATLVAACDLISRSFMVTDVAAWFEVRILPEAPIRPMDLYAAGRIDLLLDWAGQHASDPESLLEHFDSEWRQRYATDFEVFEADDGELALRLKAR